MMAHDTNVKRIELEFDIGRIRGLDDLPREGKWSFVPLREGLPEGLGDEFIVTMLNEEQITFETSSLTG